MFELIELPYKSLAPVISDETLGFHHGKHLQGYVDNLNKLLLGSEWDGLCHSERPCHSERSEESILEEIVAKAPAGPVFNNAGQILNHNLYFQQFAQKPATSAPAGPLAERIAAQWGSLEAFQVDFEAKGTGLFGSGWVWLQADEKGELSIAQYAGADNPVAHGLKPILTFDVWEHAYYLDYQNRRAAYLKALWGIVDWKVVEKRFLR
jgi:Fe-Mn family superoxide dismutase